VVIVYNNLDKSKVIVIESENKTYAKKRIFKKNFKKKPGIAVLVEFIVR